MNSHHHHSGSLLARCQRLACGLCLTALPLGLSAHPWSCVSGIGATDGHDALVQTTDNSERNLTVFFIDHEPTLPSNDVIEYIRQARREASELDNSVIFYMPNNQEPLVALYNVGESEDPRASIEAFDNLCAALNLPSHNKDAFYDRRAFVNLFKEFDIIKDDHTLGFRTVHVEFLLTKEFWELGYNETILPPIYFALDVPNITTSDFTFGAYLGSQYLRVIDKKKPFGDKNLSRINEDLGVIEYNFE